MTVRVVSLLSLGAGVLVLGLMFSCVSWAQVLLPRSVFGSGGTEMAGASHRIRGVLGQSAVGVSANGLILCSGYWCTGGANVVAIDPVPTGASGELRFGLASPSPTSGDVQFDLMLPAAAHVSLRIYDVRGRVVSELLGGPLRPGSYRVSLSGSPRSGVYFAKLLLNGADAGQERVVLVR